MPSPAHAAGGAANNTALLIGINHAPGSTPLQGMVEDTKMMRKALLEAGFKSENIKTLTDAGATRGAILTELDRLASRTSGKGITVVSVSSHGGRSGGDMSFATGGGGRVSRADLSSRLAKVRGRLWTTISTCYAAAFEAPGLVGPNRVAVFTSSANEYSYQNESGSVGIVAMVKHGMIDHDIRSVEDAYRYAVAELDGPARDKAPILKDGISGDTVLGPSS